MAAKTVQVAVKTMLLHPSQLRQQDTSLKFIGIQWTQQMSLRRISGTPRTPDDPELATSDSILMVAGGDKGLDSFEVNAALQDAVRLGVGDTLRCEIEKSSEEPFHEAFKNVLKKKWKSSSTLWLLERMVSSDKASSSNAALAALDPLKTSLANARFSTVAQQASEFISHPENFDLVSANGSAVENGCAKAQAVLSAVREVARETLVGGLRKLRVEQEHRQELARSLADFEAKIQRADAACDAFLAEFAAAARHRASRNSDCHTFDISQSTRMEVAHRLKVLEQLLKVDPFYAAETPNLIRFGVDYVHTLLDKDIKQETDTPRRQIFFSEEVPDKEASLTRLLGGK